MSGTLILSLATLGSGMVGLSIRYCLKSKCEDISFCWGCCKIHRDTEAEVKAEELELKAQPMKTDSMRNLNADI